MMDCTKMHELLDAYLDASLNAPDQVAVEQHLGQCAECADVVTFMQSDMQSGQPWGAERDDQVVGPVLAATTGRSCSRVQEVLAGDPLADDADLLRARAHLPGCAGCRQVSAVLDELPNLLPSFASVDPGPDFTADVLLATIERPSLWSIFTTRVHDHVSRWQRRPEFSQELSYAITLLLIVACTLPGSPLREVPRHALSLVHVSDAATVQENGGTVGTQLRLGLSARGVRVSDGMDRLGTHFMGAGRGLVDGDLEAMGENAGQFGCDLRRLWKGVQSPAVDPESVCG